MPKEVYIGASGVARKALDLYVGVSSVARKSKKGYVGVDGIAREFWSKGKPPACPITGGFFVANGNIIVIAKDASTSKVMYAYINPATSSSWTTISTNIPYPTYLSYITQVMYHDGLYMIDIRACVYTSASLDSTSWNKQTIATDLLPETRTSYGNMAGYFKGAFFGNYYYYFTQSQGNGEEQRFMSFAQKNGLSYDISIMEDDYYTDEDYGLLLPASNDRVFIGVTYEEYGRYDMRIKLYHVTDETTFYNSFRYTYEDQVEDDEGNTTTETFVAKEFVEVYYQDDGDCCAYFCWVDNTHYYVLFEAGSGSSMKSYVYKGTIGSDVVSQLWVSSANDVCGGLYSDGTQAYLYNQTDGVVYRISGGTITQVGTSDVTGMTSWENMYYSPEAGVIWSGNVNTLAQ